MAAFTFTAPDGKSYTVEGPDGSTQDQAWGMLQQHIGQQQSQQQAPTNWAGLTGRALAQGVGTVADTPEILASLADRAGKAIADPIRSVFGLGPSMPAGNVPMPGQALAARASDAVGLPQPATPGQRVFSSAVSGLPAAAIMGPEAYAPTIAGGAAGQGVRENGGSEFGAFLASLLAGGGAGFAEGGLRGALSAEASAPAAGSRAAAVNVLRDEDVPVNMVQATGNKIARHIDRASQMLTKGSEEFAQDQQQALNGAFLERAGVEPGAKAATPEVLSGAQTRIGQGMDAIEDRSGATFDTVAAGDLQNVQRGMLRTTPESVRAPILQNINDMIESAAQNDGVIPGATVKTIRANLVSLASNPETAKPAGELLEALQDAVTRGSSAEDVAAYSTLRQQYRALKQIQAATNATTGNISPQRMMQVLGQLKNQNQSLYGKGDQSLVDLARAANTVIPDSLGNSGTAERFIPTLTLLESLGRGDALAAGGRTLLGVTGVGGAAGLLRNQGVVGALTSPQVSGAVSGASSGAFPGAGFGVMGDAADSFLRHLDAVEQARRDAQVGGNSGSSRGSPAVVTGANYTSQ